METNVALKLRTIFPWDEKESKSGETCDNDRESHVLCADHGECRYHFFNALIPNKAFPASCEGFDHLISPNETVLKLSMRLG